MKQKSKVFHLLRPFQIPEKHRQSASNIFQTTVYQDERISDDTDRFLAGAKEVRIYKNKVKRKQKLTSAHPDRLVTHKKKDMESRELLTSQQVIDCLPRGIKTIRNLEMSLNNLRNIRSQRKKQWSSGKNKPQESNLMKKIDQYRQLIEQRQTSSRLNYLPNLQSMQWIETLRNNKSQEKSHQILVKDKMIVCGSSKKQIQKTWLRSKEKDGFGFQLLPLTYLSKKMQDNL